MTLLLATIVDVTLLAALALGAAAVLRRRSAALRHAVLAAAVAAAILAPAFELLVPQVPVLEWSTAPAVASSGLTWTSDAVLLEDDAVADASPRSSAMSWPALLLAVWALGATVALAGLLTGLVRLRRLTVHCMPIRSGRWREIADELSRGYGLRRPVALLQSVDPSLLVTCGVLRPKIILPAGAAHWTDDRRRIVLAHELAHVRRGDGALHLAGECLRAFHWFNPLVWICCRRLRQESEYACDDVVLQGGVEATEYATHLLGVARHAAGRHQVWAAAPAIAHPSTLERRIAAMLNDTRNRRTLTRRAWAGTMAGALAIALPLAAAGVEDRQRTPAAVIDGRGDVALRAPAISVDPATPEGRGAPGTPTVAMPPAASARTPAREAAPAPQANASIAVTLLDQSGGVLPGVEARLTDDIGIVFSAVSDGTGRFWYRDLRPGQYELAMRLPGFRPVTSVLTIAPGAQVERTITLPIGSIQETITVVCSPSGAAARPPSLPFGPQTTETTRRRTGLSETALNVRRATEERLFVGVLPRRGTSRMAVTPAAQDQNALGTPVRVGGQIKAPRQLSKVNPVCPPALLPSGSTVVILEGRIGVDGHLNDVRLAPGLSRPAEFVDSALAAVRQWTYSPTLLNNQPVEVDIMVTVQFTRP